jgi:8-oxo-dGTP diphosphatase
MRPAIRSLKNEDIHNSLLDTTRQYLVGNLKLPQPLSHIQSDDIEVGITKYVKAAIEQPHTHKRATEYQYVISGATVYLDLDSGEEFFFRKGDFYLIEAGVKYAQKAKMNTEILFFKSPPGNDKVNIETSDEVKKWLERPLRVQRKDHFNSPDAPKPNSICPAAAVAILNEKDEILLLKRRDSNKWTMPGGTLDFGESLITCAIREVKEETGYDIEITGLIGTYSSPGTLVEYSDGEVRQEFTIVYSGKIIGGTFCIDDESKEGCWQQRGGLNSLQFADSQLIRINDVMNYNGAPFLK